MQLVLQVTAAAAGLIAGVLWLQQSRVVIRDNIDEFIGDLQRAGRLNALAALANGIAALAGVFALLAALST